jgi:hypothetical protein
LQQYRYKRDAYPEWGRSGLLTSYSNDLVGGMRHAGTYVANILGGAKPGDLPIEQASKFTLVINLKIAKELGIAVPPTLLSLAAGDPAGSQSAAKGPSDVGGLIPSCRLGHLRLFLDWACRQLQYRSPLPGSEIGD